MPELAYANRWAQNKRDEPETYEKDGEMRDPGDLGYSTSIMAASALRRDSS